MIVEDYYVLMCNDTITQQVDFDEHCFRMHGICPTELNEEQDIRMDKNKPFTLEPAMDLDSVGTDD